MCSSWLKREHETTLAWLPARRRLTSTVGSRRSVHPVLRERPARWHTPTYRLARLRPTCVVHRRLTTDPKAAGLELAWLPVTTTTTMMLVCRWYKCSRGNDLCLASLWISFLPLYDVEDNYYVCIRWAFTVGKTHTRFVELCNLLVLQYIILITNWLHIFYVTLCFSSCQPIWWQCVGICFIYRCLCIHLRAYIRINIMLLIVFLYCHYLRQVA